jgi:Zn-dependent protease
MFGGGIPIGRPFGIEVKLHWTWFIIFAWITWVLADSYFPSVEDYEDWSTATYWVIGLATSLLFFASVLAHEMAHSLVAKAAGLKVSAISLFIFGGVSQLTEEPKSPGVEFRLAVAGPGTSLIIGAACWGIFFATRYSASPVAGMALWLGYMNVFLAAFNMIPGFPLDGGRVLRSFFWWRSRNLYKSTRIAAIIGRGFGYLFIFGGIVFIFTAWYSWGLSLGFVGWILENAASSSYRQMALQDILRGHKVSEVMTQDCEVVPPTITVEQLVNDHILVSGRRCYSVADWGRSVGLVTANDVRAVERKLWPVKTVRDVMTPIDKLRQARPDDDLSSIMYILMEKNVNQVPVLHDNNIVGMVWRDSLLTFVHLRSELGT